MHFEMAKYVTFDCYGTLIDFQIDRAIKEVLGERLSPTIASDFLAVAERYRFDEVLGAWKPYRELIANATKRAALRFGVDYREADGRAIYEAVPTWGPHPGVTSTLTELSKSVPLVILSNAADEQIGRTVANIGVPFHRVLTAEAAQAYKPRLPAFEFLLKELGCGPDEIVHVSSSCQYDLRPARDLGINRLVFVNRRDEPVYPWLGFRQVDRFEDLTRLVLESASWNR